MTVSPARLATNRQNAQRSTGPKTEEGKARSRRNTFRHGLAGQGNLLMDEDDQTEIARRTEAFRRELDAPGEVGAMLARRAAVLSVRMEQAAERDRQATAANAQAGRDEFDADRAAVLEGWIDQIEGDADPGAALADLAATPEGIAYLIDAWGTLRSDVADGDEAAAGRAALRDEVAHLKHLIQPVEQAGTSPAP